MAKFSIEWLEKKSPEWLVVNLKDEVGNETKDVSINKTSKKGELFPEFDSLVTGGTVNGELWTSQAGKNYLFAPRPETGRKPNMERVMEKKAGMIGEAQERKAQNIAAAQDRSAWMWAKTNASTLISNHELLTQTNNVNQIALLVIDLATKIYNGEPTEPNMN